MKKLIISIYFTFNLFSFEISEDIHKQLSETRKLIENNRLSDARRSLDYMLDWFSDELNPLEIDIIRYFQGSIFILEGKNYLAIANFKYIYDSALLEKTLLDDIKKELLNLYIKTENYRLVLKFLDKSLIDKKNLYIKYLAYKNLNNYQKAYENIIILLNLDGQNSTLLEYYISLSMRLKINLSTLNIDFLLNNFNEESNFYLYYDIFKKHRMNYQTARLIEKAIFIKHNNINSSHLDEAINIFSNLMEFNRVRNTLILFLQKKDIPKYRLKLVAINIQIGEFEEAMDLIESLEKDSHFGETYILKGEIFYLQENYLYARASWFQALKFKETKKQATKQLEKIKKFFK